MSEKPTTFAEWWANPGSCNGMIVETWCKRAWDACQAANDAELARLREEFRICREQSLAKEMVIVSEQRANKETEKERDQLRARIAELENALELCEDFIDMPQDYVSETEREGLLVDVRRLLAAPASETQPEGK